MHDEEPLSSQSENTWTYQAPPPEQKGFDAIGSLTRFVATLFYLALFSFLPIVVFIALDWVVFFVTRDTFYRENWVKPMVLVAATFFSGAYSRVVMEEAFETMGVFIVGILGLMVFAGITFMMLDDPGSMYATWLPAIPAVDPYIVFGLPFIGLIGMFCYKFVSLRR